MATFVSKITSTGEVPYDPTQIIPLSRCKAVLNIDTSHKNPNSLSTTRKSSPSRRRSYSSTRRSVSFREEEDVLLAQEKDLHPVQEEALQLVREGRTGSRST